MRGNGVRRRNAVPEPEIGVVERWRPGCFRGLSSNREVAGHGRRNRRRNMCQREA